MVKAIFVLILFMGVGCQSMSKNKSKKIQDSYVVFIPGYYGSFLKQADNNKRVWLNLSQALWGEQTLALDLNNIKVPGYKKMKVDGVFDEFPVVPFIYYKNVYADAIIGLQAELKDKAQVVSFAYDWRLDLVEMSQKLATFIDKLYSKGAKEVFIVAHSMGGLIASYYLIYGNQSLENSRPNFLGADKVKKAVMLGTPFKGTMHLFRNMHFGPEIAFNNEALKPHAVASFPSSYQLLPSYDRALLSTSNENKSDFIFDEQIWDKYNWALMSNKSEVKNNIIENRIEFTQKMLRRAELLNSALQDFTVDHKNKSSIWFYIGNAKRTIHQAIVNDKYELFFPNKNLKNMDSSSLLRDGDSTVTVESAQPPKSFYNAFTNIKVNMKKQEHLELINSRENLKEIANFLKP